MALNKHTQHPHHPLPLSPEAVEGDRCLSMPVLVPVLLPVCLSPTHCAPSSGTCPDRLAVSALPTTSHGGWSFHSLRGASPPPLLGPAPCPAEAMVVGEGMAISVTAGLKAASLCPVLSLQRGVPLALVVHSKAGGGMASVGQTLSTPGHLRHQVGFCSDCCLPVRAPFQHRACRCPALLLQLPRLQGQLSGTQSFPSVPMPFPRAP